MTPYWYPRRRYTTLGLPGGKIMVSTNLGAFQPTRASGQAPAYPG